MILPGTAAIPAVHADRLRAAEATGAAGGAADRLATVTPDQHRHREVGRERAARAAGARRLDQCGDPSHRDRRPRRRQGLARAAQRAVRHDAGAGQPQADRQRLHGGLLRRRRHGRAAARAQAAPASRLHDGDRRDAGRAACGRRPTPGSTASIIAARDEPFEPQGGLVALFGNLAPKGAILKRSAADAKLFEHEGRAVVFSSLADLAARIDDPALDVDAARHPGAAERRPARAGRACRRPAICRSRRSSRSAASRTWSAISDARMSGTAFGTIVLHVTPDAASGGPLGLVRNGDRIRLSVKERRIDLLVEEAELEARAPPRRQPRRRSPSAAMPSSMRRKSSAPTRAATSPSCGRRRARGGPWRRKAAVPGAAFAVSIPSRFASRK